MRRDELNIIRPKFQEKKKPIHRATEQCKSNPMEQFEEIIKLQRRK